MKEKLHTYHIVLLIYMIQSGVIIFSLPNLLATSFGYNGWITLIFFSFIVMINIALIAWVERVGKRQSIFHILENSIPRFILYPFYLGLTLLWGLIGCMVAKQYVLMFGLIAFHTTPPMLFKLIFSFLSFLLLIKGIYNITKAATIVFYLTVWMVFLLTFHFQEFEWARLTSFFLQGGKNMVEGGLEVYTAFLGYELSILLIPYLDKKTKFFRAVLLGNAITTLIYISVSLVAFGFFSFQQLQDMIYPLIDILAYIQFPFIERIESLLFTFFLLKVLITTVLYYWAALEALQRVFPNIRSQLLGFVIVLASLVISFIPEVLREVSAWLMYLSYIEMGIAFSLPLIVLCMALLQQRKRGNHYA